MAAELRVGDTWNGFELTALLRTYPHAKVFRVKAPDHPGPVDLKVAVDPVESEEDARRVLREVAVLQTLSNRHVVKVHGSGLGEDERWFIVMESLEGAQLNHWHDFDRPLPAADAVGFIHQACLGMAELHSVGIVHRDLKPERLWVEPDRTLKIMDFSSARSWSGGATGDNVTQGLRVVGSPQYAAPEQVFNPELSPAADVYTLGVIAYEMLTGHSPFFPERPCSVVRRDMADDPAEWLRSHASAPVTPLVEHPEGTLLPPKLVELIHRCLSKAPEDRPAEASALANELGWILHHDLGAAQAAVLRVVQGDARPRYHLMLPGSHRIGLNAEGELVLGESGTSEPIAVLEWAGAPKTAEVVASGSDVSLNDQPLAERSPLAGDDRLRIGDIEIGLRYPPGPARSKAAVGS